MAPWFDYTFAGLSDDGATVHIEFRKGVAPAPADLHELSWQLNAGEVVGVLTVRVRDEHHPKAGDPYEVTLRVSDGMTPGLTPGFLQRFGWEKWLTAADAYARMNGRATGPLTQAIRSAHGRRPGRRGHDEAFLPAVAARYVELRSNGTRTQSRAPVKAIADEHQVSRNTAAGWIKQARQQGLLPKARRPGKAG